MLFYVRSASGLVLVVVALFLSLSLSTEAFSQLLHVVREIVIAIHHIVVTIVLQHKLLLA